MSGSSVWFRLGSASGSIRAVDDVLLTNDFQTMITTFSFPTQIVFGAGARQELPRRLVQLGVHRPLVVTDAGLVATEAFQQLQAVAEGKWPVFSGVHPNPTIDDVEAATEAFRVAQCDGVIEALAD